MMKMALATAESTVLSNLLSKVKHGSLRSHLILSFGLALIGTLALQAWLIHSLSRNFSRDLAQISLDFAETLGLKVERTEQAQNELLKDAARLMSRNDRLLMATLAAPIVAQLNAKYREDDLPIYFHLDTSKALDTSDTSRPDELVMRFQRGSDSEVVEFKPGGLNKLRNDTLRWLLLGTAAVLVCSMGVGVYFGSLASRPLRRLAQFADTVGNGNFGQTMLISGPKEVQTSIRAFNEMSTKLHRMQDEQQKLRHRQHLAEMGEIATAVVHSIRNPLHVIGLSIDQIGDENLSQRARRAIERVDRVLKSYLSLAVSDEVSTKQVDLQEIVADVSLEALQKRPGQVQVRNNRDMQQIPLRGHAPELRAVIHAVVMNAVEASPEQEVVEIHATSLPTGATVHIDDRGSGIPQEIREGLGRPSTSLKPFGTGLGLFLAEKIVSSRYAGSLTIEPRNGGGTRVVIHLHHRIGTTT